MDGYFVEITKEPKHGLPPVLVPIEDRPKHTGYTSVYAFNKEVVDYIMNNTWKDGKKGSVAGLEATGLPVAANRLLVDFDEGDVIGNAKLLCKDLRDLGIAYSVWETGGRSIHVHIVTQWQEDPLLPASHKKWITDWATYRNAKVDTSIYRHVGLFRLPNTIHHSTGKPKILLDSWEGKELYVPIVADTKLQHKYTGKADVLQSFWRLVLKTMDEGGRSFHVYKIASTGAAIGYPFSYIRECCHYFNSRLDKPLTPEQVDAKVFSTLGER